MKIHNFVRAAFYGFAALLIIGVATNSMRADSSSAAASTGDRTYAVTQAKSGEETATLAAGCFWSNEAIFKQIKGVRSVEPGFSGGKTKNPSYEQAVTGTTGHAETINVIYDPKVVSYAQLLRVIMTVNDPTTLNRQGDDEGTQYRSAIFYRSAAQKQVALSEIKKINASRVWKNKVVTQVVPFASFYRAEDYHLNYYNLHPNQPYCKIVIAPKIDKFHHKFASLMK